LINKVFGRIDAIRRRQHYGSSRKGGRRDVRQPSLSRIQPMAVDVILLFIAVAVIIVRFIQRQSL
jgi:hypothetical protein